MLSVKIRSCKLYKYIDDEKFECIMMVDKTYVKTDFNQMPGNNYCVPNARGNVDPKFKYKCFDKFAKKYMVWQAICSFGLKFAAYVVKGTMSSDNYIMECLEKILLPFIKRHNTNVLFWPDLASCHYTKKTLSWYNDNNVTFVPKNMNLIKLPRISPH